MRRMMGSILKIVLLCLKFLMLTSVVLILFNSFHSVNATIGTPGTSRGNATILGLGGTSASFSGGSGQHYYYFWMYASQKSTFRIRGYGIFDLYIENIDGSILKHETVILTDAGSYDFAWDTSDNFGGFFVVKTTSGYYYSFEWVFEQYVGPFPWNWVQVGSSFDYAYEIGGITRGSEGTLYSSDQYYKVPWSEGQGVAVSIRGESGTDFDVYIYDGSRNLIASATSASYPDTVAFVTGSYPTYIKVHSYSGSGEYRLQFGKPALVDHNVSPVYVRPGQTFSVGYEIQSPFYDDIPVGLGCSIRSPSDRVINDPAHDTLVSVSQGTNWYYRDFTVPLDAAEGWYDVSWAIWGRYSPSTGFAVEFDSDWWVPDRLYVDRTPPPAPMPDDGASGWSNDNTPTFTWSPPYDASGIAGYYWKVDDGPENWITSNSVTLPPQSDGTHTFYVKAKDNAGNMGQWGSHTFQIDTTVSTPVPDDGVSGWSNDNTPTFTWSPPSDLSGIAGYYWKVDSGSEIWTVSTYVTLPPQSDGSHTFYVKAKDNAGNVGNWGSHTFQIDTTAPPSLSVTSSTHPDQNRWYNNSNPIFNWNTPSDMSGIAGYSCEINQTPDAIPPETITTTENTKACQGLSSGVWYFHVRAKDNAGNWGPPSHYKVSIDVETPTCVGLDDGVSGWSEDNTPTFTWTGTDAHSGIEGYYWRVDNGPETWTTSTSVTLPPQQDGTHTFYVRAKDRAGNLGSWISHTFQIDTTPPNLSDLQQNPSGSIINPPQPVNVRVRVSDNHSGIQSVVLSYRTSEDNITWSSWISLTMNKIDAYTWEQTIPQQTPIKYVQYKITAYDHVNNSSNLPNTYCYYQVIPEFSAITLLMLLMLVTTILALMKRKTNKTKADLT